MTRHAFALNSSLVTLLLLSATAWSQDRVIVVVPAKAGAVNGSKENSDAFIWRLFTEFTAPASKTSATPVAFETWASDDDTFSLNPHWPKSGEPLKLHASVLGSVKTLDTSTDVMTLRAKTIDVPCKPPPGAAVGGFPTTGKMTPCIAEQVARNHVQFDYIVNNKLNTQAGLAAAYKQSLQIDMPTGSVVVKGDWVPLRTLLEWVPQLGSIAHIRKLYYIAKAGSDEYALVSMHVASRQNPNWVWGTFEHQMNPGRCDYIGCSDTFGAQIPAVAPNKTAINTQYGACPKTQQLKTMMANANLSPVWENYCLKSTEVDFTAADGTPYALGNSVIEGILGNGNIAASSCIACHAYASFGPDGAPTAAVKAILAFNPLGNTIQAALTGSRQFSFNWGVLLAPKQSKQAASGGDKLTSTGGH